MFITQPQLNLTRFAAQIAPEMMQTKDPVAATIWHTRLFLLQ
jgi:hypothetical protein